MEGIVNYQNYEEYKREVNRVLNKTVEDFVAIGYLLKKGRDTDILKDSGYANVNEFAEAEYHLDASQVSRFIRINDRFAVDGYSSALKEEYRGYGYAKLAIMLTLPEELTEELSPAFSKTEIQAVKEEVEEEQKITDIEVILEGEKEEQKELSNLEKGLHQLFDDEPELFRRLYEKMKEEISMEALQEILAPSGEQVYSVRVQGFGRIMLILNDSEEKIIVFKIRSKEKEFYDWEQARQYILTLITEDTAEIQYEKLYGKEFPKREEQPKEEPKKRKEAKVQKAKKPEKKEIAPVQKAEEPKKEEPKQEEPKQERKTEDTGKEDQIPGQTELTKDFPQYCPDNQESAKSPYGNRKAYIDKLPLEAAAGYMANAMRNLPHFKMNFKEFWEEWLSKEVDEKGEEIEEVIEQR